MRVRARAVHQREMRAWWSALLFSLHLHIVTGVQIRSKSLLQGNRWLSRHNRTTLSRQEPDATEEMSAERVVAEGAHEIKRLMKNEPTAVSVPTMSYDRVPESPPHKNEISDGDLSEVIDQQAAENADLVNAKYVAAGMPMDFIGNTCRQVCTMCEIAAESSTAGAECGCKASCIAGPDPTCRSKIYGWSSSKVTVPETRWKAKCNAGSTDCSECIDEEIKERMAKCKKERIPAVCEHDLKMQLSKPETPVYYCTQESTEGEGLATCDKFLYRPKENGWTCYHKEHDCQNSKTDIRESLTAHEKHIPPIETPCVWCSIPIKKPGKG